MIQSVIFLSQVGGHGLPLISGHVFTQRAPISGHGLNHLVYIHHAWKTLVLRCCISHRIHVWYIHLHLVDFYGKCGQIYHTWILWVSGTTSLPLNLRQKCIPRHFVIWCAAAATTPSGHPKKNTAGGHGWPMFPRVTYRNQWLYNPHLPVPYIFGTRGWSLPDILATGSPRFQI